MKRLISIFLVVVMLLSCGVMVLPASAAAPAQLDAPGDFVLVDENDKMALYLDYGTGIFGVMNLKTGTVWYSNPADRANDTIATSDTRTELSTLLSVGYLTSTFETLTAKSDVASFVTEHNKDDIILSFYFSDLATKFIIPIKLTLMEDYLRVELMLDKIKELGTSKVLSVSLLQFFGAAGLNDTGYAVLSDGTGSIMEFNSGVQHTYEFGVLGEGTYYAENPTEISNSTYYTNWNEPFRLPLLGMVKNGEAYINIIESGAAVSETHAYISRYKNSYNTAFVKVNVRDTQSRTSSSGKAGQGFYYTDVLPENYVGRYYLLDGEDANYVGLAEKYREYLIEEKGMTPLKDDFANTLCVSLYGAVKKSKHFLGIPYTGVEPLTTFNEAGELVDKLVADNIDKVYMNYLGWNDGGLESTLRTNFDVESSLGGKKAVNNLIKKVNGIENYHLSFDLDLQAFYKENSEVKKFRNSAYGLNSSPVTLFRTRISAAGALDKGTISHQLINPIDMPVYAKSFVKNASAREVMSFSFNNIGETLYCAYNSEKLVTRDKSAALMTDVFVNTQEAVGENGLVSTSGGNLYAAPYVDNIVNAPVYGSHNNIAVQEIPFYQLVFRGYVNLASEAFNLNSEREDLILRLAQTGMSLYYLLMDADSTSFQDTSFAGSYACALDDHYDEMIANYKRLKVVYDAVGNSSISDFEIVNKDLKVTTFSNGAMVYVNYSDADATVNGVAVKANDFTVVGGANS